MDGSTSGRVVRCIPLENNRDYVDVIRFDGSCEAIGVSRANGQNESRNGRKHPTQNRSEATDVN